MDKLVQKLSLIRGQIKDFKEIEWNRSMRINMLEKLEKQLSAVFDNIFFSSANWLNVSAEHTHTLFSLDT